MTYTLIWPYRELGWHINTQYNGKRKTAIKCNISMRDYVCFRMSIKGTSSYDNLNPVLSSGKLTHQLIIDYYCRIEGDRLKHIRSQQSKLRLDTYSGLADALQTRADNAYVRVVKLVVLLSSFMRSPQNMVQNYQDAMAIVRKFGKPDLFITFTCNAS